MTCITSQAGNRYTAHHHQRETSALESARQNRHTDPLHTASAERSHTYAQRHADAGVPVDVLKEPMDHKSVTTTMGYYNPRELHQTGAFAQVA
jgi:hypothetical protein